MKKVRVRYAPSPTGLLHIGNARSALFNYLFARHYDGDFIIRIEDTDTLRNVEGGEESQLKYLKWLGISWNEGPDVGGNYGPYRQLERLSTYQEYAHKLIDMGYAYKEFNEDKSAYAIRFKVDQSKTYRFDDLVRGTLTFLGTEVEDWIILKENGIPTYNFAVVIDDHLMDITHVLRGEEHITNTPKQIMVYEAFNFEVPTFGHMTIIVNEQRKKLSKRDKDVVQFISEYANLGYLPDAMFNFISLLGFSPKTEDEILSPNQIIESFDPKRLSKSPAMFDKVKLGYINGQYIKKLDKEELANMVKPFLENANIPIISQDWLIRLSSLLQERMTHVGQIVNLYEAFFHETIKINDEALNFLQENNSIEVIKLFYEKLNNISEFTSENISAAIKETGKELSIKGKPLFMATRIATTGDMHGPSLPETISLIGKKVILNRLKNTQEVLKNE